MALDVGDACIGIALSDTSKIIAQPYDTMERKDGYWSKLQSLIISQNVGTIVVGIPYELNGSCGAQAEKVMGFINRLTELLKQTEQTKCIGIEHMDERFTTEEAARRLRGTKLKNKQKSMSLDKMAACIMLEAYLLSL